MIIKAKFIKTLFITAFIIFTLPDAVNASKSLLSSEKKTDKKEKASKEPTYVTADSMDLDMKKKLIVLIGNVVVNDGESKICADKINIYLKEKGEQAENKEKSEEVFSEGKSPTESAGAQRVDKIIALGHVVIERILPKKANGQPQPKQKAIGGKAVYDADKGTIVLTQKPMLIYGKGTYTRGRKITLWRKSNRLKVEGNRVTGEKSSLVLTPHDQQSLEGGL